MQTLVRLILAGLILAPATLPAAELRASADVRLVTHDNVGRSRFAQDQREATALEVEFAGAYELPGHTEGVFTLDAVAGLDVFDRFAGLSQRRLGVGGAYDRRLGLGVGAPWWRTALRVSWSDHNDRKRDGVETLASTTLGRDWDTGVEARLRVEYLHRDSRGGDTGLSPARVFDLSRWSIGIEADWSVADSWGVFAGVGRQRGHINTSTTLPGMITGHWTDDPVFGPGWRTYRVNADVTTLTVGTLFSLGPDTVVEMAVDHLDARSRTTGVDYDARIIRIGVSHGF